MSRSLISRFVRNVSVVLSALVPLSSGCASQFEPTIARVSQVDLPQFMGEWYVIANVPSPLERNAYDAVEAYELRPDGRVQTTFRYRSKSFDAPLKTMRPIGTVQPDSGNAIWGMQFIWPIQAEYVICYLSDDYSQTIIGRSSRDYAWVMARTPTISEDDYGRNLRRLETLGYDVKRVRRVPQSSRDK
jgi:apolipoprotein D and lipocalin family protein